MSLHVWMHCILQVPGTNVAGHATVLIPRQVCMTYTGMHDIYWYVWHILDVQLHVYIADWWTLCVILVCSKHSNHISLSRFFLRHALASCLLPTMDYGCWTLLELIAYLRLCLWELIYYLCSVVDKGTWLYIGSEATYTGMTIMCSGLLKSYSKGQEKVKAIRSWYKR